jgi:DNA-binding protein Alba
MPEMQKTERQDNVVFVGKKPSMSYVLAVITQFSNGQQEVHIKARGRAISRAVDVAEIVRKRFAQDVKIKNIEIGTEERDLGDKGKVNVSTIDILLSK